MAGKFEELVKQVNDALPEIKSGTLRLYGEWFGRPFDNLHSVTGARVAQDHTEILFDEGEVLSVWEPEGVAIDSSRFHIRRATRVQWTWYSYGSEPASQNLRWWEWEVVNQQARGWSSNGEMFRTVELGSGTVAVELV